jgi:peptidyl-prolyl cis-trans isomerase D
MGRNKTASVRFVSLPYASISDSSIEVTDAELKTLYNATMKKYKQEASSSIEYVTFEVMPSDADRQAAAFSINKLAEERTNFEIECSLIFTISSVSNLKINHLFELNFFFFIASIGNQIFSFSI